MASNGFAKILKRNSWRLTTILVYAVLEWMLIFLLLLSALFQYITTKFASFFSLHPPCLWCSRLDHIIEPKEPDFYRKLICERHAKEISQLGYCLTHRKLAEAHGMCEECAFSRPSHVSSSAESNENKRNWITCMSMVADMGFNLPKKAVTKGLLTNGHIDEFKPQDAESDEKPINGWVSKELCSCCNAPLNHKLYSHNVFKTILFNGHEKAILKSQWNALDYHGNGLEGVLEEEDGLKKQSRCVCGRTQVKIQEMFVDSCNESDAASSSSVSDGESHTKENEEEEKEEKVDDSSIGLEENAKDVSETHSNGEPDGAENESRSLEVVEDYHAGVHVQSDICVDKRIQYPEIATQECAMVSDVTVTEIAIEETPNDQVIKRLAFVEEPEIDASNPEAAAEAAEDQNEADVGDQNQVPAGDFEHQNEAPAMDTVCNSREEEDSISEGTAKGLVTDAEVSSNAEDIPAEIEPVQERDYVPVKEQQIATDLEVSSNAEDIPAEIEPVQERDYVPVKEQEIATEDADEDQADYSSDHMVAVSETFPTNKDDQVASLISEEGGDETKDLECSESDVDRRKELEADHKSADIITDVQATSTDVATNEANMEISEGMDVDSGKEDVHAGEGQVSEDIEVTTRDEQTCNGHVGGGLDGQSSQNMDQNEAKTDYHVQVEADKPDEDRASETPRSIEGIHLLSKRLLVDRRDSGAESLDGSVTSEIDGEFEVDRLKRALETERKALNTLYSELEEERNAAAVAANQTMAMITRLQEEKAAVQMEALQYQRMMEEQSEYDQEALQLLNEILVKREKEKQELEKELELYRKKLMQYEAKERRMEKRRKIEESGSPVSVEKGDETPDSQSRRNRTSSSSSLSDNSDDVSSDPNDVDDQFEAQHSNQNTPADLVMSAGRGYGDAEQRTSLDESLADFEEERLSILEQLKVLEDKLHTLANDDPAGMTHPEGNGIEDSTEISDVDKETLETMNGNGTPNARRAAGGKAKRLLPLFDATSGEEDSLHHTEEFSLADPSNDWRTVSMFVRDNNRLAIEEEVYHLYERLQALEADREFLKHTIKSLRKGDEGMKLLQEIAEHLRDLRRVELKARNFSDIM